MWYWGDSSGSPVALQPLITHLHEQLHIQYLADRDKYRATLPTPLPRYWYDNTLRYAAKVYEMQQCSASSLSTRIRIVMNKGWHGGNRIKSKKATEEAGFCYLCGSEDSQAHWLQHCTDISLSEARKAAKLEIQNYSRELIPSAISSALLSVFNSTDELESVWPNG